MDKNSKQRFDDVVKKTPDMLTEEEKGFLRARQSYIKDADKKKFSGVLEVKEEKEKKNVKKGKK